MTKIIVRGRKSICQILDCSWPKAKKELKRLGLFNHDDGGRPILIIEQYIAAITVNYKKK